MKYLSELTTSLRVTPSSWLFKKFSVYSRLDKKTFSNNKLIYNTKNGWDKILERTHPLIKGSFTKSTDLKI